MGSLMFYSQCGEDKLMFEKYFSDKKNGVFLELGAMDGVKFSNTKFFEDQGWTGYLIEPDPVTYKDLPKNRPNSKTFNKAITLKRGKVQMSTNKTHAVTSVAEGMSDNFKKKWHKNSTIIEVDSVPISDLVKFEECPHIDFWSLDVEGRELDVLMTFDWRIQVDYILIETLDNFHKEANDKCREFLKSKGYSFKQKVAHNELWVKVPK